MQEEVAAYIPRGDETEVIKASIRERPPRRLIDLVKVELDEKLEEGVYWASLLTANINHVNIAPQLVQKYERLLTAGVWCNVLMHYDDSIRYRNRTYPFVISRLEPVQVGGVSLEEFCAGRGQFTTRAVDRRADPHHGLRAHAPGAHPARQAALPGAPDPPGRGQLPPDRARPAPDRQIVLLHRVQPLRHAAGRRRDHGAQALRQQHRAPAARADRPARRGRLRRDRRHQRSTPRKTRTCTRATWRTTASTAARSR